MGVGWFRLENFRREKRKRKGKVTHKRPMGTNKLAMINGGTRISGFGTPPFFSRNCFGKNGMFKLVVC